MKATEEAAIWLPNVKHHPIVGIDQFVIKEFASVTLDMSEIVLTCKFN